MSYPPLLYLISTPEHVESFAQIMQYYVTNGAQLQVYVQASGVQIQPMVVNVVPANTNVTNVNNVMIAAQENNQQSLPPLPQQTHINANNSMQQQNQASCSKVRRDRFQCKLPAIAEDQMVDPKPLNPMADQFTPSPSLSPCASPPGSSPPSLSSSDSNPDFDVKLAIISKFPFEPFYPARANLNIYIDKSITNDLMHRVHRDFLSTKALYYYLDMSTALQINDGQMFEFGLNNGQKVMFANYDIFCKVTGKRLYAVIRQNDKKPRHDQHRNYDQKQANKWLWNIQSFRTEDEILSAYDKLLRSDLPKSSRKTHAFQQQLDETLYARMLAEQAEILDRVDWKNLHRIKNIKRDAHGRKYKGMEHVLKTKKSVFIQQCKQSWFDAPVIPIVVNENKNRMNAHWVEWLKVVRVDQDKEIGISCKYNPNTSKWEVRSLCLDKGDIINKHRLCGLDEASQQRYIGYLENFNQNYSDIIW
eukprot:CAMPEP_0197074584 /NCGR_PEP_ID=MMETSP1384-20130603/211178_1 /TAXON_ID=29189 /ORGANISM="Ammonia sp." /LENGTH=474 /DNA_ID=CAMNT_0042513425 /DNA_START=123 /DNA_END=1544 /DNA_ORIENTATION=+